jgi:phosphate acetyltransferase
MKLFDRLKQQALQIKKTIVFPEGTEPRVLQAVARLQKEGLVQAILLGQKTEIAAAAHKLNLDLTGVKTIDPDNYSDYDKLCADFVERRQGKNTLAQAQEWLKEPSYFGTMLVYEKIADGMVSGAVHSTANTVRPALQIIKTKPGQKRVSGAMLLEKGAELLVFADCAMNIDPDSETLAEIARQSAQTAKMAGLDPVVAMLSFSSKGSAKSPLVDKVTKAVEIAHETAPELTLDGELQFDAAYVPEVGNLKAPGSKVAGHANVFVFPDLQAANIGYKIAQRLGGYTAVGPVLQGLAAPINDLSRGAKVEDIYLTGVLTAAQAQED